MYKVKFFKKEFDKWKMETFKKEELELHKIEYLIYIIEYYYDHLIFLSSQHQKELKIKNPLEIKNLKQEDVDKEFDFSKETITKYYNKLITSIKNKGSDINECFEEFTKNFNYQLKDESKPRFYCFCTQILYSKNKTMHFGSCKGIMLERIYFFLMKKYYSEKNYIKFDFFFNKIKIIIKEQNNKELVFKKSKI
jgi:hypothetical protein